MMDSTRRSILDRVEAEIASLPNTDPRRNRLKFIRYGLLYGSGFPKLNHILKEKQNAIDTSR